MKIWILGAGGGLGREFAAVCQSRAIPYVGTTHAQVDITNLEALQRFAESSGATHWVNCAAYTDVEAAETHAELAFRANAEGPALLGRAARERGAKVLHISTDYVFDGNSTRPYLETDPCNPVNIYGKSKWEGEQRLLEELPTASVLRVSWLFGRGGKSFLSSALNWMKQKPELLVANDQMGRATYCKDLAEVMLQLYDYAGIFHFANAGAATRYEMALEMHALAKQLQIPLLCEKILPVSSSTFPTRVKRPNYSVLDTQKIEKTLGIQVRSWKSALKEYLEHV